MPKTKVGKKKAPAPAPKLDGTKASKTGGKKVRKPKNPLFVSRPKNFGIGGDIQPKRDLTRFVRWPKYVKLQRQKRVLLRRLSVPPPVNQFNSTLDKNLASNLFTLLHKYRPESSAAKKARLQKIAAEKAKNPEAKPKSEKPYVVKYGLNHIVGLIENNKAKLVVIAHDVDPLELVLVLPTLCKKKNIPYVIVKSKSRLGKVVHKKTAAALAITDVRNEDRDEFEKLKTAVRAQFLDKYETHLKTSGGKLIGRKTWHKLKKRETVSTSAVKKT
eukprot:TRINITY_DN19215_c0_g1_i1.p3 TRINITY_DN19215_c0_g1~~TRINITY_DN19215_c0_g1_i1.p3  ORF type:complete len:273 (-),score=78.46 TRINITY_DN19215_c0_g1_i1:27-845(-)